MLERAFRQSFCNMFRTGLVARINLQNTKRFSSNISRNVKNTLDQKEVDFHQRFAQDWWDEERGPMRGLHAMNAVRIPFLQRGLVNTGKLKEAKISQTTQCMKGIKILDVGCGGGLLSIPLSRLGAEVTGIDPSQELISVATTEAEKRLPADGRIRFLHSTVEDHCPANKEFYDAVVLSEVIEHITSKEEFIHTCVEALKPRGSIFLTTFNRTIISWLSGIIIAEYVLNYIPRGTHEWQKFPTPEELSNHLKKAGCKTLTTSGMVYQPFSNKWYIIGNNSINYGIHAIKQTGT